jgi:hypothetical protein
MSEPLDVAAVARDHEIIESLRARVPVEGDDVAVRLLAALATEVELGLSIDFATSSDASADDRIGRDEAVQRGGGLYALTDDPTRTRVDGPVGPHCPDARVLPLRRSIGDESRRGSGRRFSRGLVAAPRPSRSCRPVASRRR